MASVLIENARLLTMVPTQPTEAGSLRFDGGVITHIGHNLPSADRTIDAEGCVLLPSFIQTHIHLCQTLFRNLADGLSLMDWLRLRIWPMEATLQDQDMLASARLGLAELIGGGTTTLLDMGTVHHTDQIGVAVRDAGCRAFIGKAMMDDGAGVPARLHEATIDSLRESEALAKRWHGAADGRIQYAYAPRFAPSCTTKLLETVGEICREQDLVVHTHCAESVDEIAIVRRDHQMGNLEFMAACGLTGPRSVFAHMVHLDDDDIDIVKATHTSLTHCPSSNCKLASGIAPIPRYLAEGITVGLGADGAPCNNTLDAFFEMRLAGILHAPRFGPDALTPMDVLAMATTGGAKALGIDHLVGTLEPGKRADILQLRLNRPFNGVAGDPAAQIVYTGSRENVVNVWCDGRRLVEDGQLTTMDEAQVMADAGAAVKRVEGRL